MQINHDGDQILVAQKRRIIMLRQIKAILINNILLNIRRFLFLKEILMIVFILTVCIVSIQISGFNNLLYFILFYSVLAMIFASRSEVTLLNDNRQRYTYFLKAYGMNSFIYIMSWVIYTLVLGILKYAIFIISIYAYLKIQQQNIEQYFSDFSSLEVSDVIGYFCFLNFLAYLSTYSYSLFAVTILSKNQIGLKLLSPILFVGLFQLFSQASNSQINFYLSPTGWLMYIMINQNVPSFYQLTFCGQFLLPLITSICLQLIKINRIYLIKRINKTIKNDIIPVEQFELVQIKQFKRPLIKFINLTKKYGKKIVLNQINAIIYQGEIIMLYGKNGSGKTTLINILSNLQYFSDGTMHTDKDLKLGVSLQNNYFQNELTVKENVLFYAQLKGVIIDNAQSLMDRFQLTDFCEKEYYKISGGNRKKMSLACAFLGNNDLIILDEPTMGIDSVVQQQIQRIMIKQKRRNQKLTMIISTCQIGISFLQIANRIWILDKNQLLLNQTIQNIKSLSQDFVIINFKKLQKQKINRFLTKVKLIQGIQIFLCHQTFRLQFSLRFLKIMTKFIDQFQLKNNISISISNVSDKINKLIQTKQNVQNRRIKILNFKQNYQSSHENNKSFFSLFYASLIICLYQIIPSFVDLLYFCGILFYFLGLILINVNLYNGYTTFFGFYPFLSAFIYSHIYVSYLQNRETQYQTIIFQMGMKKAAYWLAHYIVNILIITLPLIIVFYLQLQNNLNLFRIAVLLSLLFSMFLISISYFVSLFFKINHIYKNFLPVILSITYFVFFNTLLSNLIVNLSSFIISMVAFVVLFFLINHVLFKWRNRSRKIMSQSKGIQLLIENAIDQKINVAAIVQEKSEMFYNSLIIQNIYQKYSQKKFGIKGLNMVITQGTVFGLMGMNGSGKSTTIKMILNEIYKSYGNVYFQGKEITEQTSDIYDHISVSPQEDYLNCDMSIYNHLKIFCLIKGVQSKLQKDFIISLLTLFDMEDQMYENIKELSGGVKKKLKFITALLGKSKYIFLDEPNIGVDEESQDNLRQIVQYFSQKHKTTTVIISHRIDYIRKICKKVAIIKRGSLLFIEEKKNLVSQYSRGYEVRLLNPSYQEFSEYLIEILDEMFKVYQISKIYDGSIIKISIPFQRVKSAMDIIKTAAQLYEKGYVGGFEIKEEDLQQVYKYIVFRNEQNFRQIIDQFLKMKAQNSRNQQI